MELAKKFLFSLDSKSVKTLRDKSFTCYNTDTIKLIIEVIESDDYKTLYDSNIEVIYSYPNGERAPIKQIMDDGGIAIEGENLISIVPKDNCLYPTEYMRIDVNIYDEDEFITLQPFAFKVYESTEGQIMESAQDTIKTMNDMKEQVSQLEAEVNNTLENVSNEIEELLTRANDDITEVLNNVNTSMEQCREEVGILTAELDASVKSAINSGERKIAMAILSAEMKVTNLADSFEVRIQNFVDESINEVETLKQRIENLNTDLDEVFLRSVQLTPTNNNERILFVSETIGRTAKSLVNKSYILTVTGSPYVSNVITSSIGFLYFTLEGDNVVANFSSFINKSVQGNSISTSAQFDNGKNSISKDTINFKIQISTNLLISCVDNASATITSNTVFSNI